MSYCNQSVHTKCFERHEVTINSGRVNVPLEHLAEQTKENQRERLVRKCLLARNKMKHIVAKIYAITNCPMRPFSLDIQK